MLRAELFLIFLCCKKSFIPYALQDTIKTITILTKNIPPLVLPEEKLIAQVIEMAKQSLETWHP